MGHSTSRTVRLWMRAEDSDDMRTVGVAAVFRDGTCIEGSARYFRLHREYDRTGWVDFEGLDPNTDYTFRMGSILTDSTDPDDLLEDEEVYAKLPLATVWERDLARLPSSTSEACVRTFSEPAPGHVESLSFMFGSCRYPGILAGKKRADEIFRAMTQQLREPGAERPLFTLMIGDQIYADQLHKTLPITRADTAAEFHDRYVEAFTSPYFRGLTRSLPTYMILDDHEIEDNWTSARLRQSEKRTLFNHAIHAYLSYQWLHGPRTFGKRLYYHFECAGVPFFVLDQRSERIKDDDDVTLLGNHLLGYPPKSSATPATGQLDRLCAWLANMQAERGDVPKFIVSPSVFAPSDVQDVKKPHKSDSWPAFPNTRRTLLATIIEHNVQNVVFLCGDVHSSHVAEIRLEHANGTPLPMKLFSITSSAFYWPFPFADGDDRSFVHDSALEGDGFAVDDNTTMHYRAWGFIQEDNFTKVTVSLAGDGARVLHVRTYDRKGKLLRVVDLALA